MKSFKGKVAAITGAASGMGRSLAVALARRGCEVAISDVHEPGLLETARLVREAAPGIRVSSRIVDVADRDQVYAWAKEVASEHGGCNLIFNNAGIAYSGTAERGDERDFERLMAIDFWGVVHGTRAFLPYLRASGDGHVVNTSSVFGLIGVPTQSAYNAAKFAVRGFTESLRMELEIMRAPVSATCVHPGGIKTNVVKASKTHHSVADLGIEDPEGSKHRFERAFRTTSDEAAEAMLRGVQKNARRVLIGADAHIIDIMQRALPSGYHAVVVNIAHKLVRAGRRAVASRRGGEERSSNGDTGRASAQAQEQA